MTAKEDDTQEHISTYIPSIHHSAIWQLHMKQAIMLQKLDYRKQFEAIYRMSQEERT